MAPEINEKMYEFQASLGLLQLQHVDRAIARRHEIYLHYCNYFRNLNFIRLLAFPDETPYDYEHFHILVGPDYPMSRDTIYQKLKDNGNYARWYFYPLTIELPMYRGLSSAKSANLSVAVSISRQIICMPIYPELQDDQIDLFVSIINRPSSERFC